MLLLVVCSVFLGAASQRITGMGFALIASPALVILLGAFDGVIVVNLCAVVSSLLILPRVWRRIDRVRLLWLGVPALIGTAAGAVVATELPGPVLQLGVGVLVIVALTVTLVVTGTAHRIEGRRPALIAGAASGFMNASAGVGGPALSVYAVASRWSQSGFAATAQAYFVAIGVASLIAKFVATGWAAPGLGMGEWAWVAVALFAGLVAGELLHARVGHRAARTAVIIIAYLGGTAAVIDGALHVVA